MSIGQYQTHVTVALLVLGIIQAITFLMQDEPIFAGLGMALAIGAGVSLWVDAKSNGETGGNSAQN